MLVPRGNSYVTSREPGQAHLRVATDKLCGFSLWFSGSHSSFPSIARIALDEVLWRHLWSLSGVSPQDRSKEARKWAEMGGVILIWDGERQAPGEGVK